MKIKDVLREDMSTVSGAVATVVASVGPVIRRTAESDKAKYSKTLPVRKKNARR